MFIANVHQYAVEDRQNRPFGGHGNPRLRGQRGHPHSFQCHRFAAGIRPADHQYSLLSTERKRHRNNRAIFFFELVFQHGVARGLQPQLIGLGKFRPVGVEIARKSRTRKNAVQFRDRPSGGF